MSVAELERFENDVHSDTSLMKEVKAAGTDEKAVVAFAKSKGYDFTLEELLDYVEKRKALLSDEDLDKVAGGAGDPTLSVETSQASVGTQITEAVMINPVAVGTVSSSAVVT